MLLRYYYQNMPSPVLNQVEQQEKAVSLLAQGQTHTSVADQLNISRPVVSKFAAKNREKIETMMQSYINAIHEHSLKQDIQEISQAPEIAQLTAEDIKSNPGAQGTQNRISWLQYIDKKVTDLKRSIGLLSSHNVAIAIQNMSIYHSHTSIISPVIMQALGISGAPDAEDQGVDAEFYEST